MGDMGEMSAYGAHIIYWAHCKASLLNYRALRINEMQSMLRLKIISAFTLVHVR